jgi:ubiquinone/menaquinone biosynthesis C-methylase UbiE
MTDPQIEFGSEVNGAAINEIYNVELLQCMDLIGRDDFYGIVAWNGIPFFSEKLALTPESHLLELCSGIGGPARFLARTYGCKVTGIDLSEFNTQTARKRTRDEGLEHLATFLHGDALQIPFPEESFTHVFGCEGWCYFPDKEQLYQVARRVLKPGGMIAFLEAACDDPVRLNTEQYLAPVHYESIANYKAMLGASGFQGIEQFDTTSLACKDVSSSIYRLITR